MLSRKDVTDLYLQYGFEAGPEHEHYFVFFLSKRIFPKHKNLNIR